VPIALHGHIVRGLKAATNLVERQKPCLRKFFPQIDDCKVGTINVQLDHALDVRMPDIVTPPIVWQFGSNEGERFGFTKIDFELSNNHHEAWIYSAEYSSHRFNYMLVEILARPIEGVMSGLPCTLHLGRFTGYVVV
jgi:hypothetical protein